MIKKNYFSENLKYLLKKNRYSQDAFANKIGKKRSVIGSYTRGESQPSIDDLIIIADIFAFISLKTNSSKLKPKIYDSNHNVEFANEVTPEYNKITLLHDILKGDDKTLNNKLDIVLKNQVSILERLDRSILKELIESEESEILKGVQKKQ